MRFDYRCAVVTGAASGMGRLHAARLAGRGVAVHALDRDVTGLTALERSGGTITAHAVDVTDPAELRRVLEPLADDVDLVVTAAGIGHTGCLLDTDAATFATLMAVNYLGTVNTLAPLLPTLARTGRGHVVIYASVAGWVPLAEHGPYNATKAAVIMYAEVLRQELASSGVGVTCVCPPAVATPLLDAMPASQRRLNRILKALPPERVVAAAESAVDASRFWVFPSPTAQVLWRLRRHTPRLLEAAFRRLDRTPQRQEGHVRGAPRD